MGRVEDLPGWAEDDHAAAFTALRAGCGVARDPGMQAVCAEARAAGPLGPSDARRFFETRFRVAAVSGDGVLTAYFAPEYDARTTALRPLHRAGAPSPLVGGGLRAGGRPHAAAGGRPPPPWARC